MASVSAAELVTASGKVVVAGCLELERQAAGTEHLHGWVVREKPERLQAGAADELFRSDADQFRLLAARQCILGVLLV